MLLSRLHTVVTLLRGRAAACGLSLASAAALGAQTPEGPTAGASPAAASVLGRVLDDGGEPLAYASVVLYAAADSSVAKAEVTDDDGAYRLPGIAPGRYFLSGTYVGLPDVSTGVFELTPGERRAQPDIAFALAPAELAAATVSAERRIVEIKPDRTVFNIEGTINAVGGDGMSLLRKAPGVVVDNGDGIIVMGRTGVLVYVDGKRSPLAGEALTAFLRGLPAEQIDRIDIITNPGAKYEAEGNAGIIDIRLKKNEAWGSNGSVSSTLARGRYSRGTVSATVNHRRGGFNTFATGGAYAGGDYGTNVFERVQSGFAIDDDIVEETFDRGGNLKLGTDYALGNKHTFGLQASANVNDRDATNDNRTTFARANAPGVIDSILVSRSPQERQQVNLAGNANYGYTGPEGESLNVDLDYGAFRRDASSRLPGQYLGPDGQVRHSSVELAFDTPSEIDIYTASADYGRAGLGGRLGAGARYTRVVSDNTFRFFEMRGGEGQLADDRSNRFLYDEAVAAAYVTYARDFGPDAPSGQGKAFSLSAGLRAEQTRALGDLRVLDGRPEARVVDRDYLSLFPNVGLTWDAADKHRLALSYGRRINRPDYANLNPFRTFSSLVIFEEGNPGLRPEIVNSVELAHTFASRYTTKLTVSRTTDEIARLTRQADFDERAQYLTWTNLDERTVVALNVSVPAQVTPWWEVYFTGTASHIRNRADYADGSRIDLTVLNVNFFNQHTFDVGGGWKAEVSGWFSGPGVWAGTIETDAMGALDLGAQKRLLDDKLRLRAAVSDLFFTSGWNGRSDFGGTVFVGGGVYDSRRVSVSATYRFGNQKVRVRQRKTGIREAADRVGE